MKNFLFILLLFGTIYWSNAQILFEDFEDATVLYTTNIPEFSDGSRDYFTRTDGSNISGAVNFTGGPSGSFWFGAQDTDTNPSNGNTTVSLTFAGIDITGQTDLMFSFVVAEDDDGTREDWDADSRVSVFATIDGGSTEEIFRIEAEGGTNTVPRVDTDFDGIGDGAEITDNFTQYLAPITGTGSSLTIVIEIAELEAGDEDIAFDNVSVFSMQVPLPVELSDFTAEPISENQVALSWTTASEEENDYFQIEKSRDGQKFEAIGKVKGAGNSLEQRTYQFVDDAAKAGVNYYRLVQFDYDGTMEYHQVVAVAMKDKDAKVEIYPTLVNEELNVNLEGEATVSIMNISGALVKEVQIFNFTTIDVSDLMAGTYFLVIKGESFVEALRLVKQ